MKRIKFLEDQLAYTKDTLLKMERQLQKLEQRVTALELNKITWHPIPNQPFWVTKTNDSGSIGMAHWSQTNDST